jgi:cysteine-S-conjugate beta-lyase
MDAVNPLTELSLDELRTRRSVKWNWYPPDVLPMFIAEMDTPLAPVIAAALSDAIARGDTGYAMRGNLAHAYADFAERRYGWSPDPTAMLLIPDVNTGIYRVLHAVAAPGGVVLDTPAYPPLFAKIAEAGRTVVENPMRETDDGFRPDLAGLERAFAAGARTYLMCNPHNPTGTVFDVATLAGIAEVADHYRVRVLSDEIHGPLTYPGVKHVPFQTLPAPSAQAAITFVSASKAWNLPGLKAGLAIPGPAAVDAFAAVPAEVSFGAGILGVIAGEVALSQGREWLEALLVGLDDNRRRLATLLAAALPEVGYRPPDATYLAWLDLRALDLGDDPAEIILERGRLALHSGLAFGAAGRGFARLNLATRPELIDEAVRRMVIAVRGDGYPERSLRTSSTTS